MVSTANQSRGRCAGTNSLVNLGLEGPHQTLGRDPAELRAYSNQFERMEKAAPKRRRADLSCGEGIPSERFSLHDERNSASIREFMGWFTKSLKGIFDPRSSGESIIERQEEIYGQTVKMYPEAEPHQILALVYLSRMATHGKAIQSPAMQAEALAKTYEFSCLPFPKNIRALGISFIEFERPDIMEQCMNFESEFGILMIPIREAQLKDQLGLLYRQLNPRLAQEMK